MSVGQSENQGVTQRPVILWISQAATVSMALLLIVSAATFAKGDASILGIERWDASWFYYLSGVVGLASVLWRRLRLAWLMLLTVCTLGRAVELLVAGSPVINDRGSEFRGAFAWWCLWVLGSVPTIYAQASEILRGRIQVR